jgi:GT2 family glycosyltransferase
MDEQMDQHPAELPNIKQRFPYFLILVRALRWFLFGSNVRRLAKVWATYKAGGIRLCWSRARKRFGAKRYSYDHKRNQLSRVQSEYILARCSNRPLVSIVVPVYKTNYKWLKKCISSVVSQHNTNWELILIDDASEESDPKQLMNDYASKDKRIRAYCLEQNLGITGATNFGIKQAKGEFIGFLDHDDELTPDALTWMVWALNKHPGALWFYSDEDLITATDKCHSPRFKPDFSPEFLLSNMYTCHFSIYSTHVLNKVGGIRQGFDGSQYHDLVLRLSEVIPREKVVHIPRVLYHRRQIPTSAAAIEAEPKAPSAGCKAVAEALERRHIKARVTSYGLCPAIYRITFQLTSFPRVSIIIPTKNYLSLVQKCIHSIRQHTSYPNYEIIIINNASDDVEFLEYIKTEQSENRIKVIHYDKPFDHSEMNNIAVQSTNSDFVVFMNNDIEIISDEWLEQLVATAQMDESIGVVGAMLLYPDGKVQHGGIVLGIDGVTGHAHQFIDSDAPGYLGRLQSLQEVSCVTAALMLVKRSKFNDVGGFNSGKYPTLCNDVDLCIRLRKRGFRCIFNPMVKAIHLESKTRVISSADLVYKAGLQAEYSEVLEKDPFYNPNLALDSMPFMGYRPFPIEMQIPELEFLTDRHNH